MFLGTTLLGTTLIACGGGQASKPQQASAQPEPVVAPAVDAGQAAVASVVSTPQNERRVLEYLPSAYGVVIHLSLRKLEASEFFNRHESELLSGKLESQRQEVVSKCHFDPLFDIDAVTLAVDLKNGGSPEVMIALTTPLGATRFEECVVAMGGSVKDGKYVSAGDEMGFYWPTEDIVLLSEEKNSDAIAQELSAGTSLENPSLMEFLSRTDRNATVWGAGVISSAVASALGSFGGVPKGFVVRGSVWAGVDISIELSFATTKEADSMMSLLKMGLSSAGQSSPARELISATDIEQLGTIIRLDAQLSPSLSAEVLKELQ